MNVMGSTRVGAMIDSTLEQAELEDETKSDLHALRKELEKSIATDTHLSLGVAANSLLENSMIDMNGGSVVSGVDREPAVVVDSYGNARGQNPESQAQAEITSKPRDTDIEEEPSLNPEGRVKGPTFHGKGDTLKGSKVTKKFGRKYYGGEVIGFDPETNWYKVVYDDGDQEELWWWELEPILVQSGTQQGSASTKRSRPSPVSSGEHKVKRARKGEQNDGVKALEQENVNDIPVTQVTSEEADVDTTKQGKKRGKKRRMNDKASAEKESKKATQSRVQETSADSGNQRSLKSKSTEDKSDVALDLGSKLIGRETRKDFDGTTYKGKIIGYDPEAKYYKICYEDGDEEELEWSELKPTLLYENSMPSSNGHMEPEAVSTGPITRSREKAVGDGSSKRGGAQPMKELRPERKLRDEFGAVSTKTGSHHPALEVARFAVKDAGNIEFYAWGEVAKFSERPPQLQAVSRLQGSSYIVHIAASHHHLAALTAAGQVWVWRNQHDNIYTRCNEWEHISDLDDKGIVLVDIAGLDLDRSSAGYAPNQEDQVPDPFYLVAVSHTGKDYILQGSQPQETVRTYSLAETQHLSLEELLKLNDAPVDSVGRVVQVSVGTVEAPDEPPFVGYITDTDRVYIRSATKDFMEEVNHVAGFSGRPLKIQCGRAYHAIIMTDNGRAWTWGRAYHSGLNIPTSKLSSPFAVCQAAPAALAGRKVVDIGCYGESFIALTEDGEVHQWTHSVTNPFSVYNSSGTSVWKPPGEDRLKKIALGAGISAGISASGKLHTWRTFPGSIVTEKAESATPFARDEKSKDTTVNALGTRSIVKVLCVAGSIIAIGQKLPC